MRFCNRVSFGLWCVAITMADPYPPSGVISKLWGTTNTTGFYIAWQILSWPKRYPLQSMGMVLNFIVTTNILYGVGLVLFSAVAEATAWWAVFQLHWLQKGTCVTTRSFGFDCDDFFSWVKRFKNNLPNKDFSHIMSNKFKGMPFQWFLPFVYLTCFHPQLKCQNSRECFRQRQNMEPIPSRSQVMSPLSPPKTRGASPKIRFANMHPKIRLEDW